MMRRAILMVAAVALSLLVASGVALAVNKVGTQGRDFLKGTDGADTLVGKRDSDRIFGLAGQDNLIGGPGKDTVAGGGGFDRVFADTKDSVAPDCEKVADSDSEFGQLDASIPQSFWDGLPAPWGLDQYPSMPGDYAKAT